MAFKFTKDTALAVALVSMGGFVSVAFISMGYLEPIMAGLIAIAVGIVLVGFEGVVKYFGYGLIAGAVGTLGYYYLPRSMATSLADIKRE